MQANADKGQTQMLLLKQQKNFSRKGRKRGQRTPKKPVITNSRHSGTISGIQPKKLTARPIQYAPSKLAASVPAGKKRTCNIHENPARSCYR